MDTNERLLQTIGTAFLLLFSALLLSVRYIRRLQVGWRDAILLAALYNLIAVTVRISASLELLTQSEGRTVNGLVAGVFLASLLISVIGHWRMRRAATP